MTMLQAAWKLDEGRDAAADVLVAKWWASQAGQEVVHITQHLHGGMGADIDYPVHRYFLWGKQIEDTLGGASAHARPTGRHARGGDAVTASVRYEDVNVGDRLPDLAIPLTRTLIVSTAIASRDYQDVHHDPGLAQERGSQDIFMNILTTNGFVGRFVTDWAGPNAVLKTVKIRLGAPNYPGDTMTISGEVTKKEDGVIEVTLRGANSLGDHVIGTVELELPDPPISWGEPPKKHKKHKKKDKKAKKKQQQAEEHA